jgi:hypothetical protein
MANAQEPQVRQPQNWLETSGGESANRGYVTERGADPQALRAIVA